MPAWYDVVGIDLMEGYIEVLLDVVQPLFLDAQRLEVRNDQTRSDLVDPWKQGFLRCSRKNMERDVVMTKIGGQFFEASQHEAVLSHRRWRNVGTRQKTTCRATLRSMASA